MNSLWQAPAVILSLLAWLNAPPAGLVDIAQREALRRAATPKSAATLSNLGLPDDEIPVSAVTLPPPDAPPTGDPAAAKGADPAAGAKPPEGKEEKPEVKKDEKWWRQRIADARLSVERGELAAEALQSRINALQADAVNIDDPIRQSKARQDLIRALDELERTRTKLDSDRKEIAAIQEEARRANVPAGWVR